jgi:transposase
MTKPYPMELRLRAVRFVEAGERRNAVAERLGVFNGPINCESFLRYVEQFLVPTLKSGDIVIMDNLGSHKGRAPSRSIRSRWRSRSSRVLPCRSRRPE